MRTDRARPESNLIAPDSLAAPLRDAAALALLAAADLIDDEDAIDIRGFTDSALAAARLMEMTDRRSTSRTRDLGDRQSYDDSRSRADRLLSLNDDELAAALAPVQRESAIDCERRAAAESVSMEVARA